MSSNQATHLVLDDRPSQPTGREYGKNLKAPTTPYADDRRAPLRQGVQARRQALSDRAAGVRACQLPSPVYESEPSDSAIAFTRKLERRFGAYYSSCYRGGLTGQLEFRVQCYSVFAEPQQPSFGAQLYVVYQPDAHAGDPPPRRSSNGSRSYGGAAPEPRRQRRTSTTRRARTRSSTAAG